MTIEREFHLKVLGRTLEHLGVQMYKRRDTAIAELVANCWDAGATRVDISVPTGQYDPDTSEITIVDDGSGMSDDDVEDHYLVLGRNRRAEGDPAPPGRPVMGRKGIGKLAGFGIARRMAIETWTASRTTRLELDLAALKTGDDEAEDIPLRGTVDEARPDGAASESGTKLTLSALKHATALDVDRLHEALARRFSRTVKGAMEIRINDEALREPTVDFEFRIPEGEGTEEVQLNDGGTVRYWYGFSRTVLQSAQMRGFTILVNGKTAQAPNFFFDVEGTATGQHGTKYLTGVIEADYLDASDDDGSDLISTDRQEIDWEDDRTQPLREWGARLTRDALAERSKRRGDAVEQRLYDLPDFKDRIDRLEKDLQRRVRQYLRVLGEADAEDDKMLQLADSLIRAFEYRHFHDVVEDIDAAGTTSPDELQKLLGLLREWKVLESRAILEIVRGRLEIIDKFAQMLAEDAPETAHRQGEDNLHDLLAEYPWIINPEWQVLYEEKRITTQVREWGKEDADSGDMQRYDFLALAGGGEVILIEIKRPGRAVEYEEVARLDEYAVKLERAHGKPIKKVLISSGNFNFNFNRPDIENLTWDEVQERTRSFYEHYRAVLEGRIDDVGFGRKERELHRTREVVESGSVWRGPERRQAGLGGQEASFALPEHLGTAVPAPEAEIADPVPELPEGPAEEKEPPAERENPPGASQENEDGDESDRAESDGK